MEIFIVNWAQFETSKLSDDQVLFKVVFIDQGFIINNFMSVYSGFATRAQESKYNGLLETLIITLKKRIVKFYAGESCDEDKFKLLLKKIYKKLFLLEKGKFMAPKYSSCFTDLIESLHITVNYDTLSQCSSMMSQTFSLRKDPLDHDKNEQLRSKNLLTSKRNLLEVKASKIFNSSTLSLPKNDYLFQHQNQQEQIKHQKPQRSTSFDPVDDLVKRQRSKSKLNDLKNLRQLRGTINMPKVEDFLPKKEQLQPVFNPRRNTFLEAKPGQQSPKVNKVVFRRNKYSRAQVKMEDI